MIHIVCAAELTSASATITGVALYIGNDDNRSAYLSELSGGYEDVQTGEEEKCSVVLRTIY